MLFDERKREDHFFREGDMSITGGMSITRFLIQKPMELAANSVLPFGIGRWAVKTTFNAVLGPPTTSAEDTADDEADLDA
jgi:hypothetical protein